MEATQKITRVPFFRQYVAGGDYAVGTPRMRPITNPFNGAVIAQVAVGTVADAETALARAAAAFAETRALSAAERHAVLRRIEAGLTARREEFAQGIVAEGGKTIRDARTEVDRATLVFGLAADEARRWGGEVLPLDINAASRGRVGLTRRFPVGTVAALTPFNFPLNLVAHKVAPALAVGAPVILKPAERTPLTALRLAELVSESGYPRAAFSVLTPDVPQEVAELLATDERAPVFSFTGSDIVGWRLKGLANRKRATLELGGNAGVIVAAGADAAVAAARCVTGAFANAGQVCISVQRIFVHESLFDTFAAHLVEGARLLVLGNPAEETTDLGPMITPTARENALALVRAAEAAGATALLRGAATGYAHLPPTVLTGTTAAMRVRSEEAFAPVVCVEPFRAFADALALVNEGRFGLQAGVFTPNIAEAFAAWEGIEAGGVVINDVPQYRVDNMPYGGEKASGFGREGVRYAMEEMTAVRLLVMNAG